MTKAEYDISDFSQEEKEELRNKWQDIYNRRFRSHTNKSLPERYSFKVANYALSDVIESLISSDVKDLTVTKEDNDLIVMFKPYWRR